MTVQLFALWTCQSSSGTPFHTGLKATAGLWAGGHLGVTDRAGDLQSTEALSSRAIHRSCIYQRLHVIRCRWHCGSGGAWCPSSRWWALLRAEHGGISSTSVLDMWCCHHSASRLGIRGGALLILQVTLHLHHLHP